MLQNLEDNTIINRDVTQNIHTLHDRRNWFNNTDGTHDISTLGVQGGTNIGLLQNLQNAKPQLQQLGANAVYIPETNSVVLLIWEVKQATWSKQGWFNSL